MNPAVLVSQVYKRYGNLEALYGIDFSIAKGSFFGLLGPNGAGKSTLINIMAGLVHSTSGNIKVSGYDVRKQWRKSRQVLGVVPQELAYDPFFSTREMLRLQSGYFGLGKDNYVWVDELLERLGLGDKADENLGNLSGGMKRRVLIAQALVHKPEVLVLDEPTAGVDVELRRVLWEFVRELHKNGHTILLTTHYLEEAESFCDRIAILDNGRLIAHDTTNALLNRYPYRFLRLSVNNSSTQIPEKLLEKVVLYENNELTFRLHRENDNISDVLDAVQNSGISFTDLHTDEPGLEEVFLALTVKNHD